MYRRELDFLDEVIIERVMKGKFKMSDKQVDKGFTTAYMMIVAVVMVIALAPLFT